MRLAFINFLLAQKTISALFGNERSGTYLLPPSYRQREGAARNGVINTVG